MFDIGFSELVVVGVVALIVIGPERLPKVARTAGHLLGRFQRYASSVKSDISREMQMEELRKVGHDFKESIESTANEVKTQANVVDEYLKDDVAQFENAWEKSSQDAEMEWDDPGIPASQMAPPTPVVIAPHPQQSFDLDAHPGAVIEHATPPHPKKPSTA